jgi:hypothetical protein
MTLLSWKGALLAAFLFGGSPRIKKRQDRGDPKTALSATRDSFKPALLTRDIGRMNFNPKSKISIRLIKFLEWSCCK